MSNFPALSGVLNSGERAEDPQSCLQSSAQNKFMLVHVNPITLEPTNIEMKADAVPNLIFSGQYKNCAWVLRPAGMDEVEAWAKLGWILPEYCAQCNSILRIEVCGGMILEFCDECDPEFDA